MTVLENRFLILAGYWVAMRAHTIILTLVLAACATSMPARKHQLTKAEIQYKSDTKTLYDMLAKLMNTHDGKELLATTNQGMLRKLHDIFFIIHVLTLRPLRQKVS